MAVFSGPKIVDDGLIFYLDASNEKSYIENSSNWSDLKNNSNDGVFINSSIFNQQTKTIFFDGTDERVILPTTGSFKNPLPLTLSAWIKGSGTIISTDDFNCNQTGGQSTRYYGVIIGCGPTSASVSVGNGGGCGPGGRRSASINFPTINEFYNIVITINTSLSSNQIFFFINGIQINASYSGTGTTLSYTNNKNGTIAGRIEPVGLFNGNISNISIYNKILTLEEIKQNFEALRGRFGI